jgi:hypothetical protein
MNVFRFDIAHPEGRRETLLVDSERILVGSGAHCDVRLPAEHCAPEQLVMEVMGDTIKIEARVSEPKVSLDGDVITHAAVASGQVLTIGDLRVRITRESAPGVSQRRANEERRGVLVKVVGAIAAPVLAYFAFFAADASPSGPPATYPALWSDAPARCPVGADQANAYAEEKHLVADGKRERHPFYLAQGVEAVSAYETAATCYRAAGDGDAADGVTAAAKELRTEIEADYRVRRLRLERALLRKDDEVAAKEVAALSDLTTAAQGPYVEWLAVMRRKWRTEQ